MKILVIKFRHIGDVLLTTPLIRNLKLNYPQAKIDVVINKECKDVLKYNPNINKIFTYNRKEIKKSCFFKKIVKELKFLNNFKNYDIVINTTEGDRGAFIAKFSKAKIKIGYPPKKNILLKNAFNIILPKPILIRHMIENNLDVIRVLNKKIFDKKVEIFWSKKDEEILNRFLPKTFIHIHPVSRWLFKCLEDKTVAQIIDFIKNKGIEVILTGGTNKKELQKINNIISLCKKKPINLSGKLSLNQVAFLASKAKFFIGVDTAVMHIAAAVNTPVIAFFGPSGAFNWGPWDNNLVESGYTKKNGIQKMGKHIVIQHNWECIPCGKAGCNDSQISKCLMEIDLDLVFNIIEKYIENML